MTSKTKHRLIERSTELRIDADRELVALVDALVSAIDTERTWEIEKVHSALAPFGGSSLFADELRLNGQPSTERCECTKEGWL